MKILRRARVRGPGGGFELMGREGGGEGDGDWDWDVVCILEDGLAWMEKSLLHSGKLMSGKSQIIRGGVIGGCVKEG